MFRKKDLVIIIIIVLILSSAVALFIYNRQQFKVGEAAAIIDDNAKKIFVSLPAGSDPKQNIYFNFPYKNNSVYLIKLSSGCNNYNNSQEVKLEKGKLYDFEEFIFHARLIIKSDKVPVEYDLWVTTGEIPILVIDSDKNVPDEPKVDCSLSVLSNQKKQIINDASSKIELTDVEEDVKKYSYSLNIKENPVSGDVPRMLDFKASKRFSLQALYYDRSFLRQSLAYDIFKSFSGDNIAPDSRFVELYFNDEYRGLYLLSRRVDSEMLSVKAYSKKDKDHSVIYEATGKKANYMYGAEGFSQVEPDLENDGSYFEPLNQLASLVKNACRESFFEEIKNIIDIDNLIDNHILFLICGSTDEQSSNQFIYRGNEKGDKFKFIPGNHYNSGFGRDKYSLKSDPEDIFYPSRLYNSLYEYKAYREILKQRWNYLKKEMLDTEKINEILDKAKDTLKDAQERNFKKWPVKPDIYGDSYNFYNDVEYVKKYIGERFERLDRYLNNPPLLRIGDAYAFINEESNIIFCSLPEGSGTRQKISWEFDDDTEIFLKTLNHREYINFNNDFEKYSYIVNKGKNTSEIIINIDLPNEDNKSIGEKLKIRGWALNPVLENETGVNKILVFDGPGMRDDNFLGAADYGQYREDTAGDTINKFIRYCGFQISIDTLFISNGTHDIYIYAFDNDGNYSVRIISQLNISNHENKVFKLMDNEIEKLENGMEFDFKQFIFHGNIIIKNNGKDEKYELFVTTGNTPVVLINAENWITEDIERTDADMKVIYHNPDEKNFINAAVFDFDGKVAIKLRGKSTLGFPKKQYSIEVRDSNGEDLNVSLLGMPKESDWVLSAPYSDKTLIRMPLAFELSNQMGLYAPRTEFVEVFLMQEGSQIKNYDYRGLYILTESIKRDKDRVNIQKLDSDNEDLISGGYILEMTSKGLYNPHETYIETLTYQYIIKYPNRKNITDKQKNWITDYMNNFESTLYGKNFMDTEEGYLKYIDVDSFIDFILINELFKNKDAFGKSTFMSIDRNSKLKIGPIWDFDLSSGNNSKDALSDNNVPELFLMPNNRLCNRLFLDPYFVNRYIARWKELRNSTFSDYNIIKTIDEMSAELSISQERNFSRWQILGKYIYPNPPPYAKTHQEAVEQLKCWLLTRAEWIDYKIDSLHDFASSPEKFEY